MLLWASGGQYTNHLLITLRLHISQPSTRGGRAIAFRSSVPSSHSSRPSTRGCRGLSFLSLTQFPTLYKRMSCPFVPLSLTQFITSQRVLESQALPAISMHRHYFDLVTSLTEDYFLFQGSS